MNHFIISAKFGVFIFQGVETVRTSGNDFRNAVAIEHLNIVRRLHLEEKFIARATGRIAGARFFRAEYGKLGFSRSQDFSEGARYTLGAIVKRARASNPK